MKTADDHTKLAENRNGDQTKAVLSGLYVMTTPGH